MSIKHKQHLARVLQDKQKVMDAAIDGLDQGDGVNIYDQLEAILLNRGKK